jgi:hypothetical protein
MKAYYVLSKNHAPCFFDADHSIVENINAIPFNKEGVYAKAVVEADNEFLAGIEFARMNIDEEALFALIDFAVENSENYGEIPSELAKLIEELNPLLPSGKQFKEGTDYFVD